MDQKGACPSLSCPLGPSNGLAPRLVSFRGAAEGCEPGIYIPEACVHGFRVPPCGRPRNDMVFVQDRKALRVKPGQGLVANFAISGAKRARTRPAMMSTIA